VLVESDVREIVVVLLVALIGVLLAAGVVLAPWHPAQATPAPAPVTGFVTDSLGQH
jgi:flagellar basal body-associated protein FliL